jgi:hypothetical protein
VCWLGLSIAKEHERRSCTDVVGDAPVPSIVTSATIVGAVQAATVVALGCGLASRVRRFHVLEGTSATLVGYRGPNRDSSVCPEHLVGQEPRLLAGID